MKKKPWKTKTENQLQRPEHTQKKMPTPLFSEQPQAPASPKKIIHMNQKKMPCLWYWPGGRSTCPLWAPKIGFQSSDHPPPPGAAGRRPPAWPSLQWRTSSTNSGSVPTKRLRDLGIRWFNVCKVIINQILMSLIVYTYLYISSYTTHLYPFMQIWGDGLLLKCFNHTSSAGKGKKWRGQGGTWLEKLYTENNRINRQKVAVVWHRSGMPM